MGELHNQTPGMKSLITSSILTVFALILLFASIWKKIDLGFSYWQAVILQNLSSIGSLDDLFFTLPLYLLIRLGSFTCYLTAFIKSILVLHEGKNSINIKTATIAILSINAGIILFNLICFIYTMIT